MSQLVANFLKQHLHTHETDSVDKVLTQMNQAKLIKDFDAYVYKVYFYGYVKKTIRYSSLKHQQRVKEQQEREALSLNIIDEGFHEERINTLPDTTSDLTEHLNQFTSYQTAFDEISPDPVLSKALKSLTDRQKEILYRCVVLGESDTRLAAEKGVTKQGINKLKHTALNKVRSQIVYQCKQVV